MGPALACLGLFLAVNLAAYLAFWGDKAQARKQRARISEARLLGLALAGGWVGAKLAQRHFRHKTRKQPFRTQLDLIPVIWAGLAAGYFMFFR